MPDEGGPPAEATRVYLGADRRYKEFKAVTDYTRRRTTGWGR